MSRPDHLPDFRLPPLNEVVFGVQFAPARGYRQIQAWEVWTSFRDQFPDIEELSPLPPTFETFGLPQGGQFNLRTVTGPSHDRFWFLSPNKDELIQFQQDRLLHNWRKVGDQTNEYPRFENMILKFESELETLEKYFSDIEPQQLNINQSEITYVNHIPIQDADTAASIKEWLRFIHFEASYFEDFSFTFRRIIRNEKEEQQGRLICEYGSAVGPKGQRMILLNLTARGRPSGTDTKAAIEFLKRGHEMVVNLFAEITTDLAHKKWERVQ